MGSGDRGRRPLVAGWTALAVSVLVGCAQVSPPVVETTTSRSVRAPVVFVPGVTGVELRNASTDRIVWGLGKNLLRPHDRGHGAARSVTDDHPGPEIVPGQVILDLKLFGFLRYGVYQRLVDLFVANGYRWGDLKDPRPADDFFLFSYDWRGDNVAAAIRLAAQLEDLRRVRGQETLRVDLICQSNGAHVCRYFTRYGGQDLAAAESGQPRDPTVAGVENLILVGASNGGSIRVLRELNRGRRYLDIIGRYWSPETLFTFESLYQDLPAYTSDLFVDSEGRSMDVDLFDAGNWRRFGWSIYSEKTSRRLDYRTLPRWFGSKVDREEFLIGALDRARRFQRVLRRDVHELEATRYHLIANRRTDTSARAILTQGKGKWRTRFSDDRQVRQNPDLRTALTSPGDGHATAESQRWLSEQETERLGGNVLEVDGTHRRLILEEATHRRIMQILANEDPVGE